MDTVIVVLKGKTLGNLEQEDVVDYTPIPMANDYQENPILTFMPDKLKIDGKMKDVTRFHLSNGQYFYADMSFKQFFRFKKELKDIQKHYDFLHKEEQQVTWQSYLQSGKVSSILN